MIHQREYLYFCRDELQEVLQDNYSEYYGESGEGVDWEFFNALEFEGKLRVFVTRVEGKIVAYCVFVVAKQPNISEIVAQEVVLYVTPQYRGSGVATDLLEYCEEELNEEVNFILLSHNADDNLSELYERLGYTPYEITYKKVL